jgi:hypothetical protein
VEEAQPPAAAAAADAAAVGQQEGEVRLHFFVVGDMQATARVWPRGGQQWRCCCALRGPAVH